MARLRTLAAKMQEHREGLLNALAQVEAEAGHPDLEPLPRLADQAAEVYGRIAASGVVRLRGVIDSIPGPLG